jgi:uncharacterized FlaG/YvyC family protein
LLATNSAATNSAVVNSSVPTQETVTGKVVANATAAPSDDELQAAAQTIQNRLSGPTDPPAFSVDYLSGLQVMTVRAASSGTVVFQIPNSDALRLAQLLREGSPLDSMGIVDTKV